jgi:hypothetical protein
MSVDFPPNYGSIYAGVDPSMPIKDVFVLIGGFDLKMQLVPFYNPDMRPDPGYSSTAALLGRVQGGDIPNKPSHEKAVLGIIGTYTEGAIDKAMSFIKENFHPQGKLIIHGHSMGGVDVLKLSRKMDGLFYDFVNQQVTTAAFHDPVATPPWMEWRLEKSYREQHASDPRVTRTSFQQPYPNGNLRVDLLVTVDAALGGSSAAIDRTVGRCVRTNLNYYQTNAKPEQEKSVGGPNRAVDPSATIVWNQDLTPLLLASPDPAKAPAFPDHYSIQAQVNNLLIKAFLKALDTVLLSDPMYIEGVDGRKL